MPNVSINMKAVTVGIRHTFRIVFVSVTAILSMAPLVCAQTPTSPALVKPEAIPIAYDVASIRQNKSGSRSSSHAGTDDRYSSSNVSLKSVLAKIFNIKEDLIFGIPVPIDSARFDIEAKVVDPDPEAMKRITLEQSRTMLLPILAQRFQLKTHIETKNLPVYDLVVTKDGPKFGRSADQTRHGGDVGGRGDGKNLNYTFQGASMSSLTNLLTNRVHRTVIDKTGLVGYYDFALTWAKRDTLDERVEGGPSVFTALEEQLGLKLESSKGPVETLVVDHVEMPSEN